MLPVTRAVPKEMIPVLTKPAIQYVVEEAVGSGIESIILVTSEGKAALEDYFRANPELEQVLEECGKSAVVGQVRESPRRAAISWVRQERPLGLGHAIGCARHLVGDEPFAVLLPDNLFDSPTPCLRQLIECYQDYPACILATRVVEAAAVSGCGILKVEPVDTSRWSERLFRVRDFVEKPAPEKAPSRYSIAGRYLFEPGIFECIDQTAPDDHGEIQITDGLRIYSRTQPVYALCFEGREHDVGDVLGLLKANVEYALKDPTVAERFRDYLSSLQLAD